MRTITIDGVTIECDDNVELAIEGRKVIIKAAPVEKVVHEHHYHYTNPPVSYPYSGSPTSFPTWGPQWGTQTVGKSPDPPMTSGFVQVINPDPPFLLGGGTSVTFPSGQTVMQVSDNLARFVQ